MAVRKYQIKKTYAITKSNSVGVLSIKNAIASLLCNTAPLDLFNPSNKHPSVSLAVLPLWIRTPVNPGTFNISGSTVLNRGDMVFFTLYDPAGIAVLPGIFTPFLTVSSNVSQKYAPSIYKCPIVYSAPLKQRFTSTFILCPFGY